MLPHRVDRRGTTRWTGSGGTGERRWGAGVYADAGGAQPNGGGGQSHVECAWSRLTGAQRPGDMLITPTRNGGRAVDEWLRAC
ncbi:MAG: hypothetical protein DRP42_07235 [Tenericutes bacterium]|nr:MAG: hypothetical protein DRP42_07235 [Mycoplasmatota bacterium]